MVGNIYTDHVEVVVDNTPPVLAINYNSPITTDCLPPSWQTSASASDTTPPVTLFYRLNNSTAWYNLPTPFRPALNYSGNLTIIATDGVDNQNTSLLLIPGFDQEPPALNISITNHTHTIELNDDCGEIQSGQFQVEFQNGTTSSWSAFSNNSALNFSTYSNQPYRVRYQITDSANRTTTQTTNFTASKSIFALNYSTGMVKVGNYLSPTVRFTVLPPTGGSFTTTTQHSTLGQIGSHQPRNHTRIMGVARKLKLPHQRPNLDQCLTTDAFNRTTVDTYTYLIDGEVINTNPRSRWHAHQSSTVPHTSGRTDESSWPTSSTPEVSVPTTHSVIGTTTPTRSSTQPRPPHPTKQRRTNHQLHAELQNR